MRKEFLRHIGYSIAWFALLCGTYQNPMFGTGISPDADLEGIIKSINPGLVISVIIPLAAIGYHIYGLYKAMLIRKTKGDSTSGEGKE